MSSRGTVDSGVAEFLGNVAYGTNKASLLLAALTGVGGRRS